MGFAEKYNKVNTIFDIDIKDFEFIDGYDFIATYGDRTIPINGLYINKKGMYNDHPVAILVDEKKLLDLPSHMTETVKEILSDAESINLIKKGMVGVKAHTYTDTKYHKECVGFEWCDL